MDRLRIRRDFELRAARYRQLDQNPSIRERTSFFAAACVVPSVPGAGAPTPFMATLSARLEAVNIARGRQICAGTLYCRGTILANTADFVGYEQRLVERALGQLRDHNAELYRREINLADRSLTQISSWYCGYRSSAHAALHRALRVARVKLGRIPQFARRENREALARLLAAASAAAPEVYR